MTTTAHQPTLPILPAAAGAVALVVAPVIAPTTAVAAASCRRAVAALFSACLLCLPWVAASAASADAATLCSAASGATTTPMVELYTSEGCNSCPPADRWLSQLAREPQPAATALAFHVDYWDYLGWRDRFASAQYTRRQRQRVAAQGKRVVYTPQVMINGADSRAWRYPAQIASSIAAAASQPAQARLEMQLAAANDGWVLRLQGLATRPAADMEAWLAMYEDGLVSEVRAGENRGETLRHDRVVRRLFGPFPLGSDGRIAAEAAISAADAAVARRGGFTAFVQRRRGGVVQSLNLTVCAAAGQSS